MAALDIVALAAAGVDTVFALTVSIQESCLVQMGPTVTPAADGGTASTVWAKELTKLLIAYDDEERDDDGGADVESRGSTARVAVRQFIARASDLEGTKPDTDTLVTDPTGRTWIIHKVGRVPGDSIFILTARR